MRMVADKAKMTELDHRSAPGVEHVVARASIQHPEAVPEVPAPAPGGPTVPSGSTAVSPLLAKLRWDGTGRRIRVRLNWELETSVL